MEGEGEVVLDPEAEEDVLQRRAARLVRLGKDNLYLFSTGHLVNYPMICFIRSYHITLLD